MARVRILREQELVQADVGEVVDVDAATARALVEAERAERVIVRSNPDIERTWM